LKKEVVEAVENGDFKIYAVKNIFEGIEILTGIPAGERDEKGDFPKGSINSLVEEKLRGYAEIVSEFGKAD